MRTHNCGAGGSSGGGGGGGAGGWQLNAAHQLGSAMGSAIADFLFGKPKPSGPSPEEIRAEQLRQARIAEAQRLEAERIETERQRRLSFARAARWRSRIEQAEAEMSQTLEGAFDVVRKGPSTDFFGSGNSDVSLGDDSGDTSVVYFGDRPEEPEPSLSPRFFLEQKRRAEATENFRLRQTPYAVAPRLAGDSREAPLVDRVVEGARDFAHDVADGAKERILESLDIPGLQGAKELWNKETSFIRDWERAMDPHAIVTAARTGGTIADDEFRLDAQRKFLNDRTYGYVSSQTLLTGDPRAAAVEGSRNYASKKWDDFVDVPGRLREGARDHVLRIFGLGDGD